MCTAKLNRCHVRVRGSISCFAGWFTGRFFRKRWVQNCSKNEMEAFQKKVLFSDVQNYDVVLVMRK